LSLVAMVMFLRADGILPHPGLFKTGSRGQSRIQFGRVTDGRWTL
jgi:hypothetical protein